ncbi:MAG: acyltransferase [Prevotella sp.]|nr:acyltransferase [Prevotella sp.]
MMLCIVWTHSRLPRWDIVPSYFNELSYHFNELGQDAVPVFFLITGFLFFRNFSMDMYVSKLRTRFGSLVIPYILWGTVAAGFWYLVIRLSGYSYVSDNFEFNSLSEVVSNIFASKYNVLWYIGVIIVYAIAAPLFYFLAKNKRIAVVSIIVFSIISSVFRHPYCSPLLWMPVYMLGAYLGTHYKDYMFKPQPFWLSILGIIVFPITVILDHQYGTMLTSSMRIWASTFCFIGLYDMFDGLIHFRTYKIYSYTLFLYAAHYMPLHVMQRFVIAHWQSTLSCWIAYIGVPIVVVVIVLTTACLLDCYCHRLYKVLSGNR